MSHAEGGRQESQFSDKLIIQGEIIRMLKIYTSSFNLCIVVNVMCSQSTGEFSLWHRWTESAVWWMDTEVFFCLAGSGWAQLPLARLVFPFPGMDLTHWGILGQRGISGCIVWYPSRVLWKWSFPRSKCSVACPNHALLSALWGQRQPFASCLVCVQLSQDFIRSTQSCLDSFHSWGLVCGAGLSVAWRSIQVMCWLWTELSASVPE